MKSELLPCPFCGNQPVPIPPTSLVQCIHCQISMTKDDWNTRPSVKVSGDWEKLQSHISTNNGRKNMGNELDKQGLEQKIACIIREMSIEPEEQCDKISTEIVGLLNTRPKQSVEWPKKEIKRILYSRYAITGGGMHEDALTRDINAIIDACQAAVEAAGVEHYGQERLRVAEDSQKKLIEALEYIENTAKYHYDEEAEEDDESPDDMTAHLNGLIVKKCQQALASVEGKDSHVA